MRNIERIVSSYFCFGFTNKETSLLVSQLFFCKYKKIKNNLQKTGISGTHTDHVIRSTVAEVQMHYGSWIPVIN